MRRQALQFVFTILVLLVAAGLVEATVIANNPILSIRFFGNGGGSVTFIEEQSSCKYWWVSPTPDDPGCDYTVPFGQVVTLVVTPAIGRQFSGWSWAGNCIPLEGTNKPTCKLQMTGQDEVVSIPFYIENNFLNKRTSEYFGTLNEALSAVENNDTIMALAKVVPDPQIAIDFKGKTVTVAGGYTSFSDADMKAGPAGHTTVAGPLEIREGTLIAENLVIK